MDEQMVPMHVYLDAVNAAYVATQRYHEFYRRYYELRDYVYSIPQSPVPAVALDTRNLIADNLTPSKLFTQPPLF